MRPIAFNLTGPGYQAHRDEIDAAIREVLDASWFILGTQGEAFEREFGAYVGAPYTIGCNSGYDALVLALRALEVGAGDEVLTVSHTAVATAVAISATGATPVFCDIDPRTFVMDPADACASHHTAHSRHRASPPLRAVSSDGCDLGPREGAQPQSCRGLRSVTRCPMGRPDDRHDG